MSRRLQYASLVIRSFISRGIFCALMLAAGAAGAEPARALHVVAKSEPISSASTKKLPRGLDPRVMFETKDARVALDKSEMLIATSSSISKGK
jgi:hypothetical protein